MIHRRLGSLFVLGLLGVACSDGSGDDPSVPDLSGRPQLADQPPLAKGPALTTADWLPALSGGNPLTASPGSCEAFCEQARSAGCDLGPTDCATSCSKSAGSKCYGEALRLVACAFEVGVCPADVSLDSEIEPVVRMHCSAQVRAVTDCVKPDKGADGDP